MSTVNLPILDDNAPVDDAQLVAFARALRPAIQGDVHIDQHTRLLYATDASIYQVSPLAVVVPATTDDAQAAVEIASRFGLPILPRGGGTSLAGQTVNRAVVIDFSKHCNQILDIDPGAKSVRVQPGIVLDTLNRQLARFGLMFGPDVATASHANIGGMIGNNSAGAHSVLYGRTSDHIRALDVLLADGSQHSFTSGAASCDPRIEVMTRRVADVVQPLAQEIRQRYPGILRHVDGYNLDIMLDQIKASDDSLDRVNLAQLFCGSEGTLGLSTSATLGLVDVPRAKGLAIVSFGSVDEALRAVMSMLATGPAAVELIDDIVLRAARANAICRPYVDLLPRVGGKDPSAVLYVEYFASSEDRVRTSLHELTLRFGEDRVNTYTDPAAMKSAWTLRKSGEPLLHGLPGRRKPLTFVEDLAVDPAVLPEFIEAFRALLTRYGTHAAFYAHASVGCLHVRPMIDLRDTSDRTMMIKIAEEATDLVRQFGGAVSGEHGDGRLRSHVLERYFGPAICSAFGDIKAIFDPEHRMNPGNIVAPPAMDEHLRVQPDERAVAVAPIETYYRYDAEGGFGHAVEMCNGAGMCRKTSGGIMCPSYRATRDERHATRGRGNALRLAITGQFDQNGAEPIWDDLETLETLDLCLSCKACKAECPSNVDVARLKSEYLAQSYDDRGCIPLTVSVFTRIRMLNRLGSFLPFAANLTNRIPPWRWVLNWTLGIDKRRSLPPFGRSLFGWARRRRTRNVDAPCIVLFGDCFTAYNEPHIGRAAVRVLEALGYRVLTPNLGCCGRSMISLGRLSTAVDTIHATARRMIDAVREHDPVAILGIEPSCVSAIVDDWLDLKLPVLHDDLLMLASLTQTVEDFIASQWNTHPIVPDIQANDEPVRVHGHCHQRSLWGTDATHELLSRCSTDVEIWDTGCCGMAGAFGFTRDHYDLSMTIGEQTLFPLARDADGATIVAPGTSCRHQLLDGVHKDAVHPIEYFASALLSRSRA
ncbi:MAG: FAD-linked oxidase C-terminal domain-containing protein [Planctomycetota bacterium]